MAGLDALGWRRILWPTDYSPLSLRALDVARVIAEAAEAELHVLHVVDEAFQYWMAVGPEGLPIGPSLNDVMAQARHEMESLEARHLSGLGRPVRTEVLAGRPFAEIVRYAEEHGIDLICLATHGRSGLSHALLGSVAERVVRKAPCAVLTVRGQEEGPALDA